jgi:serine/threonine protein kinase
MNEEELFHAALAKPPAERFAFLEQACSGNAALRAAVEALLAAHEAPGTFLNPHMPDHKQQAVDLAATQDAEVAGEVKKSALRRHISSSDRPMHARGSQTETADQRQDAVFGVVIGGRYSLQEKIGEGGMGELWLAKQTAPVKRKVALKLINTGMDSRVVLQRFEQERQALALMDHPNIAKVLDGGMTPTGQPYFVMELVNGLPLNKFCDELKLTLKERLELFVPICQAVQHAHQKGIVHRDLKPVNILVTMIDGKPVPKVIDFGVAKATSGKLTEETMSTGFGAVVGTLEYMSPEQAGFAGEDVDTRSDIYSLGVILYELLTGLRPIDSKRLKKAAFNEMIRIIREEEPSKPSTRLSTDESLPSLAAMRQIEPKKLTSLLRGDLDWVVMKCLEKQRERRYETANGLARDIQRYLANEAVEARPPSTGYRMKKFIHRNRAMVAAVSAVAVALVIGIIGFAWQAPVSQTMSEHWQTMSET